MGAKHVLLGAGMALAIGGTAAAAPPWRPIFDGRSLNGWTPKIAGYPLGENYADTFIVKDRAVRVSYATYDKFKGRFGHLIYRTPLKAFRLRLDYRILEPSLPDTPKWAHSNSGVMLFGQPPESMGLDQPFPVSVEFQILGPDGEGPRPTGSVCTPGTNVTIDGTVAKAHCTVSTGPTIPNGTWTHLELEVTPAGEVTHRINGHVVMHYDGVELDPADPTAKPLIAAAGGKLALSQGYISLQSEGHPIEFRNIRLQILEPAR